MTSRANTVPSGGKTMKRRINTSLLAAVFVAAPLAILPPASPAGAQSAQQPARTIVLSIGRGELVTVPGRMADVFVANDTIADVQVKSTNQLYVFGKGGGETTVYASDAKGNVIWSSNIRVGSNIDSIDQMLHLAMPEAKINVATMNGTVLLTGTVAAPEDAAEAERLVKAFVGDKTNVISRLKMATPLQVNLQVRIAEVSRTLVRAIGANLTSLDGTNGFKFGIAQGRSTASTITTDPNLPLGMGTATQGYTIDPNTGLYVLKDGTNVTPLSGATTLAGMGKFLGLNLLGTLDLGETDGLVTTLANPNLTALSGETADFLAGGEFPIPLSSGLGTTTVQYRKYGVSLSYTPTVLANGRISLRVRPEVSELSSEGAVTLSGFQIPALTIRRAETTVELGSGQSFMIAGLLSNSSQSTITKTPGAGDIPIIGNLFRSNSFKKGQTELVIVVTPYLVSPVNDGDIKLPTDGFQSPNMIQSLLGNATNDGRSGAERPKPTEKDGTVESGPQVGALDQSRLPAQQPDTRTARKSKGKRQASATDATPGFSF